MWHSGSGAPEPYHDDSIGTNRPMTEIDCDWFSSSCLIHDHTGTWNEWRVWERYDESILSKHFSKRNSVWPESTTVILIHAPEDLQLTRRCHGFLDTATTFTLDLEAISSHRRQRRITCSESRINDKSSKFVFYILLFHDSHESHDRARKVI